MTLDILPPDVLAKIRANSEPVIVDTEAGWRTGVRGLDIFSMGNCFGSFTITEDDQVFHSMIGNRPTFNREEAQDKVIDLENRARDMMQTLERLS